GTDIATGCEDVSVLADFFERYALTEAGHVFVFVRVLLPAPSVVGVGNACDFFVGQLAVGTVHQAAELAGVDEEHFAMTITEFVVLLITSEEPEAGRDLRGIEELARQRHHAVPEL